MFSSRTPVSSVDKHQTFNLRAKGSGPLLSAISLCTGSTRSLEDHKLHEKSFSRETIFINIIYIFYK